MFSKLAIVASLALLAVATPTPGGGESSTFCCGTVKTYDEAQNEGILGLINVAAEDIGKNVGVDCTSINVLSNQCGGTEVNCNTNAGLIALGCITL